MFGSVIEGVTVVIGVTGMTAGGGVGSSFDEQLKEANNKAAISILLLFIFIIYKIIY
jgi:hypothetical protein